MKWYDIQTAYHGFVYQGYRGHSLSELKKLYNAGYACVVQVMGSSGYYHFVAVRAIDGTGMLGIFIVTGVIIATVSLLNKFTS